MDRRSAEIAATPNASRHTSVRQLKRRAKAQGQLEALKQAGHGSVGCLGTVGEMMNSLEIGLFFGVVSASCAA